MKAVVPLLVAQSILATFAVPVGALDAKRFTSSWTGSPAAPTEHRISPDGGAAFDGDCSRNCAGTGPYERC